MQSIARRRVQSTAWQLGLLQGGPEAAAAPCCPVSGELEGTETGRECLPLDAVAQHAAQVLDGSLLVAVAAQAAARYLVASAS